MKTLKDIVRTQALLVGLIPVAMLSIISMVVMVRHALLDSRTEVVEFSSRDLRNLDRSTLLLEDRWKTMLAASDGGDDRIADTLLRRWVASDSGVCLLSVWKNDSLVFSAPQRDESRILLWSDRNWTGVERNRRCDEPVVRHIVHLRKDYEAVVSVRLSYIEKKLFVSLPDSGRRFALLDYQGMYVGGIRNHEGPPTDIDPLISRVKPGSKDTAGWTVENGRVFAYSARTLRGPPWLLIARKNILDSVRSMVPLLALMAAIIFATFILSIRMANRSVAKILDPLHSLRRSLDALETGHFESDLPASNLSEIDHLSSAYNRMAVAIKEREEFRRKELESMMSELEAFSYSVSHDLRAPLRSIEGYALALEEDEVDRLSVEGKLHLSRILASTRRMTQLIEDLLRLSHTSRTQLASRAVDMDALVKTVLEGLVREIGNRKIEWRIGFLGTTQGDPGLLRQVWENLLSNAIKYTSRKEIATIEIGHRIEANRGCWWIKDNGAGFDPSHASRLFRTFQRLHTDQEFEGTGIGLALARRIVEMHGGTIEAEGAIDAGSTFTFRLPIRPEAAESGHKRP